MAVEESDSWVKAETMLNHPTDVVNALDPVDPQGRASVFGCPTNMPTPAGLLDKLFEKYVIALFVKN